MKVFTQSINDLTCEDCLELVAGISNLKWSGVAKLQDLHSFKLHPDNPRIMFSIAKQVFRGTALTQKQHELVKSLLVEYYADQFKERDIDVVEHVDNLRFPYREVNQEHWLKVLDVKHPKTYVETKMLVIRFPFNKKVISRIDELKNNSDKDYFYKDHKHYFPLTERNVYKLVTIARRFRHKFDIDNEVQTIFDKCMEYEDNREQYLPGVYDYKIKNIPIQQFQHLHEDIGEVDVDNLFKYYDRRRKYGLCEFDIMSVTDSMMGLNALSKQLIDRPSTAVMVNSKKWTLDNLLDSLFEMDRLPIAVVLDDETALDTLIEMHRRLTLRIPTEQMSVMFRLDKGKKDADAFNQFVRDKALNNYVDKNTKVVYINNNKVPKPVYRSDWEPLTLFLYTRQSIGRQMQQWCEGHDFILQYDEGNLGYIFGYTKVILI